MNTPDDPTGAPPASGPAAGLGPDPSAGGRAEPAAPADWTATRSEARAAVAPASGLSPALETALERVARELLRQQRSDRRWRVFFRLAWLGLVLAIAWALFSDRVIPSTPTQPHTALIDVRGGISADSEASAENLIESLRRAFEDRSARAVVLRINSPGGSPVQAGILYDEIQRLRALHGKKIYTVVEEVCASGAYYLAAATDEIFVDKASLIGSIGVRLDGFGFSEAMDKIGVERRLITAGQNKGMLDPFSPLRPADVETAQALVDQIHRQFIAVVREGRGERLRETPEMFSGMLWNGEQAIENGLADRLGSLESVARDVVMASEIVDYSPRANVAERLARRFGASVGAGIVSAMREAPALR
jgi:protease IV